MQQEISQSWNGSKYGIKMHLEEKDQSLADVHFKGLKNAGKKIKEEDYREINSYI